MPPGPTAARPDRSSVRRRAAAGWRALAPRIRALCLFFAFDVLALNAILAALPWTPSHKTVFNYTADFLIGRAGTDSWHQMQVAVDEFTAHPDRPIYTQVFTRRHIRFPYPPTSLLVTRALGAVHLWRPWLLNTLSWLAVVAMARWAAVLFRQSAEQHGGSVSGPDWVATMSLAAGFAITFYPLVKGFALGQIQTAMNFSLALALGLFMRGRDGSAGVCAAIPCLVKPQYGLLLLWGVSRRRWRFSVAFAAVLTVAFGLSLGLFGLANHVDSLRMLAYVGQRGESYFANNSVNGLLQRALFNGSNLGWDEASYPPSNAWVYGGTLASSAVLVLTCLVWRRERHRAAPTTDLMIAMLTSVMASPVAWEHHYGVLLAIFAVLLPALDRRPVFGRATMVYLGVAYVLAGTYVGATKHTADTAANVVQSYLLFGAAMVLVCLYRLRDAEAATVVSFSRRR